MRNATGVPELTEEDGAVRVNGVNDRLPRFDLFFRPYPWHVMIPVTKKSTTTHNRAKKSTYQVNCFKKGLYAMAVSETPVASLMRRHPGVAL